MDGLRLDIPPDTLQFWRAVMSRCVLVLMPCLLQYFACPWSGWMKWIHSDSPRSHTVQVLRGPRGPADGGGAACGNRGRECGLHRAVSHGLQLQPDGESLLQL